MVGVFDGKCAWIEQLMVTGNQLKGRVYNHGFSAISKVPNVFIATCHLPFDSFKTSFQLSTVIFFLKSFEISKK